MAYIIRVFSPWEAPSLHKQRPAIFGPLWFLAGLENPHQSVFSKENYRFGTRFNSELVQLKAFEIQS